jgi:hypothetical protein
MSLGAGQTADLVGARAGELRGGRVRRQVRVSREQGWAILRWQMPFFFHLKTNIFNQPSNNITV